MIVKEIFCKSLLNKSQILDYCINPYIGCSHACVYCYADYLTRRFSKHEERWGEFVDVKINAPMILEKEIRRKVSGRVFLSSLTDPYQPLEKKYGITRKCLEILLRFKFSVTIQTKSSLVTRDLDLMKKFKEIEVGFTLTTLDEGIREKFEPFSSPVKEKLEAIKMLKEEGVKTYVFFAPVLPFLSDKHLDDYLGKIEKLKVDCLYVDKLNLKPGVWEKIKFVLESSYPELIPKYERILFHKSDYYEKLKREILSRAKNKIECVFCY